MARGIVTLTPTKRVEPPAVILSSSLSGHQPSIHRRCTVGAVRSGGCQVTLEVEGVVDGGVG
jgi:hypothetical protein